MSIAPQRRLMDQPSLRAAFSFADRSGSVGAEQRGRGTAARSGGVAFRADEPPIGYRDDRLPETPKRGPISAMGAGGTGQPPRGRFEESADGPSRASKRSLAAERPKQARSGNAAASPADADGDTTAALIAANRAVLRKGGFEDTAANLYLAHVAGPGGALKLLRNPRGSAEILLGRKAIEADPFLKGMTGAEVAAWAESKMNGLAPEEEAKPTSANREERARLVDSPVVGGAFASEMPETISTPMLGTPAANGASGKQGPMAGFGVEAEQYADAIGSAVSPPAASPSNEIGSRPDPLLRQLKTGPRELVRDHASRDANRGQPREVVSDDRLADGGEVPRRLTHIADQFQAGGYDEAADARAGRVQLARAEARGNRIFVRPEDRVGSDVPNIDLPRIPGTKGVSPFDVNFHDYRVPVLAPPELSGRRGLLAVQQELLRNPTTGRDREATRKGVLNDVGDLWGPDGANNYVKTYRVPSKDPNRSDAIINYTVPGKHMVNEGFVIRFARLRKDGRVEIITYGEGNSWKMNRRLKPVLWGPAVDEAWTKNSLAVIQRALKVR